MNIKEAVGHPLVQYARESLWGSGITTIPGRFENGFNSLPPEDQKLVRTFFTAATVSCPVPRSLAEDPKYGPDYLEKRYTSVGFWYRYLETEVLRDTAFGAPVHLSFLGGRGKRFDQGWVPAGREQGLIGPSTYEGYILPRLLIDILEFSKKYELDASANLNFALKLISSAPEEPIRLIATLANHMRSLGFGWQHLRDRLFDAGYQEETPEGYWRPIFEELNFMLSRGNSLWPLICPES